MKSKWNVFVVDAVVIIIIVILNITVTVKNSINYSVDTSLGVVKLRVGSLGGNAHGVVIAKDLSIIMDDYNLSANEVRVNGNFIKMYPLKDSLAIIEELISSKDLYGLKKMVTRRFDKIEFKGVTIEKRGVFRTLGRITLESSGGRITVDADMTKSELYDHELGRQTLSGKVNSKKFSLVYGGDVDKGRVDANITVNLKRLEVLSFYIEGDKIPISKFIPDSLYGQARFKFKLKRRDDLYEGGGDIYVKEFRDEKSKILGRLRGTLSKVGIDTIYFKSVKLDLGVDTNGVVIDTLIAKSKPLVVHGSGGVDVFTHRYKLDIYGSLSPSVEENVNVDIWNGMELDSTLNRKIFKGRLSGKDSRYSVSIDNAIVKRTVRSFFKRTFGKKKKKKE